MVLKTKDFIIQKSLITDHSVWLNSSDTWPKTTIGTASIVPGDAGGIAFELVVLGVFSTLC